VVTVPVKKDRNVEKTRTRTLGRAPGAVVNEEAMVIPDCSFFPLNLDPHGGEPASPSDSERGPYILQLSSFIIFLPHHHRHHSFSKRWARSAAVLEIVNAVPGRGATVAFRWCALIGPRAFAPTPNRGYPY